LADPTAGYNGTQQERALAEAAAHWHRQRQLAVCAIGYEHRAPLTAKPG
jgi:hypothetical protein